MKKIFVLLLCAVLLVSTIPSLATELLFGDVVTNGSLDNDDVHRLAEYLAGYKSAVLDDATSNLADVNRDGKITSADLLSLIKLIPDYKPTKKEGPIIILKCDDFKANDASSMASFDRFYNMFKEEGVTACFGIIGNSTATAPDANKKVFWENTRKYVDNGIEIWSHGWLHRRNDNKVAEYDGYYSTIEEAKESFQAVLNLVKENIGYDITCFGAPYNTMNQDTADFIESDFPQIKSVFFTDESFENVTVLNSSLEVEDGEADVERFKRNYKMKAKSDYYVIQMHPSMYDEAKTEEVRKIVKFLKGQNCTFMTPSQYTEYAKDKVEEKQPQVIILKADDLGVGNYKLFDKTYDILKEEGVTEVSFGVIGDDCAGDDTEEFWQYMNKFITDGAEIWNHGKEHLINGSDASEFSGAYGYDKMKENVAFTQNLVKENTGYQITTIGAPGNAVSEEFAKMLYAEFPEINKVFFSKNKGFYAFKLDNSITIESETEGITFDMFMSAYNPNMSYTVIQFHPNRLNKFDKWEEFRKVIQYLNEQGCVFMTPSQYCDYVTK